MDNVLYPKPDRSESGQFSVEIEGAGAIYEVLDPAEEPFLRMDLDDDLSPEAAAELSLHLAGWAATHGAEVIAVPKGASLDYRVTPVLDVLPSKPEEEPS